MVAPGFQPCLPPFLEHAIGALAGVGSTHWGGCQRILDGPKVRPQGCVQARGRELGLLHLLFPFPHPGLVLPQG